jgi:hypothetical protein
MSDYGSNETSVCSKCNKLVETECLQLQCDHNLCLPCACINLLREGQRFSNYNLNAQYYSIKCDVCSQFTSIDSDTATELLKYKPEESSVLYSGHRSPKGVIRVIYLNL